MSAGEGQQEVAVTPLALAAMLDDAHPIKMAAADFARGSLINPGSDDFDRAVTWYHGRKRTFGLVGATG